MRAVCRVCYEMWDAVAKTGPKGPRSWGKKDDEIKKLKAELEKVRAASSAGADGEAMGPEEVTQQTAAETRRALRRTFLLDLPDDEWGVEADLLDQSFRQEIQ